MRRLSRTFMLVAALAGILCVQLIFPTVLSASDPDGDNLVNKVTLKHTTITRIHLESSPDGPPQSMNWYAENRRVPLTGDEEYLTPGVEYTNENPEPTSMTTDELQKIVKKLNIHVPSYMPDGYELMCINAAPYGAAQLTYENPDQSGANREDIVIAVSPVSDDEQTFVEIQTNRPIRQVTIDGLQGCLIDGIGLVWESGNSRYTIHARRLQIDELKKIVESIK